MRVPGEALVPPAPLSGGGPAPPVGVGQGSRPRRLLVPIAAAAAAFVIVAGLRFGITYGEAAWTRHQLQVHRASSMAMPSSPQIEADWGIRFTEAQLLADGGLIELRYQILDNGKASRLHNQSNSLANIPWIEVEGTGGKVVSNSLLFHIHHEYNTGSEGVTYSIVYGNAGGVIGPRVLISIHMADGLVLRHVPVA